jgi:hypothetical protein
MSPDQLFSVVNLLAVLGWTALVVLPGRRTIEVVGRYLLPGILAAAYTAIIVTRWGGADGGFGTLPDVARLFSDPWLLLAGWMHYLAFDLFVGSWEVQDARVRGVPHVLVVPCLALTFLFGPAGWLSYIVIRSMRRRPA